MRRSSDGLTCLLVVYYLVVSTPAHAGVRDHTRPDVVNRSTSITESQAAELTLTLNEATMRQVQTWIRTAGTLDETGKVVVAHVRSPDGDLVQVGQRVRGFPVTYRTQVREGDVTKVAEQGGDARVQVTFHDEKKYDDRRYLLDIIVEQGPFLSIPNVAIIEEGDGHVVYVQNKPGEYERRMVEIGTQGELYTQVLEGVKEGEQVVSIGSFFVDAEHKLKNDMAGAGMAGMDMSGMSTTGGGDEGGEMSTPAKEGDEMEMPAKKGGEANTQSVEAPD